MSKKWHEYQDQCAAVFRKMGLNAEVDKKIAGARGKHAIDVYVSGCVSGLNVKWIAECKHWQTNIPKEKVLALLSIVQDVGADKGILLSQVGFQSGAVAVARNTNVVLTSLADLEQQIQANFKEVILSDLSWRLERVTERLRALDEDAEDYVWTPQLQQKMELFALPSAISDALKGQFPLIYAIGPREEQLKAADFDDFVAKADKLLRAAEEHCEQSEEKRLT